MEVLKGIHSICFSLLAVANVTHIYNRSRKYRYFTQIYKISMKYSSTEILQQRYMIYCSVLNLQVNNASNIYYAYVNSNTFITQNITYNVELAFMII